MNDIMKVCTKCGIEKSLDEFSNRKHSKYGKNSRCKECWKEYRKQYNQDHHEEIKEKRRKYKKENHEELIEKHRKYNREHREELNEYSEKVRRERGGKSMYENKDCASYLGIVVGERLCRHFFKDVKVMPFGNIGYDIICNKGKKIDVKTGCLLEKRRWTFHIYKNKIADYFICIAFDNRKDLNPIHMWMIPKYKVSNKNSISMSLSTLHKWNKWKQNIDDVNSCCIKMKKINM